LFAGAESGDRNGQSRQILNTPNSTNGRLQQLQTGICFFSPDKVFSSSTLFGSTIELPLPTSGSGSEGFRKCFSTTIVSISFLPAKKSWPLKARIADQNISVMYNEC